MNDPDPVLGEALRWLRFSEEDLDVASRLMTGTPNYERVFKYNVDSWVDYETPPVESPRLARVTAPPLRRIASAIGPRLDGPENILSSTNL